MSNEEKILYYRSKTIKELQKIINNPNLAESDIIIASIELQHKEEENGIAEYYTTEEVLEEIFGKSNMVKKC